MRVRGNRRLDLRFPHRTSALIICLQVGSTKDHDRVSRFIEQEVLDAEKFEPLLLRHGLIEKWRKFQQEHPKP